MNFLVPLLDPLFFMQMRGKLLLLAAVTGILILAALLLVIREQKGKRK